MTGYFKNFMLNTYAKNTRKLMQQAMKLLNNML